MLYDGNKLYSAKASANYVMPNGNARDGERGKESMSEREIEWERNRDRGKIKFIICICS